MKKNTLSVLLAACMALALTIPASISKAEEAEWPVVDGPEITINNAYSGDSTLPQGYSAERFKELVEEHSNGKIKVRNYENDSMGDSATVTEGVQSGDITMANAATSVLGNFVKEMSAFDMPMALTDVDGAFELLKDSEFRTLLNDSCSAAGFKLVGMLPTSYRVTSSNKEIRSFDDFSGLRIRTLDNKYHRAFWEALGTSPTTVAFSELYMALEQGVVDAQENPLATIYSSKFYEQQKYVIETNHILFILCYYVNQAWWDGLDENYQQCIQMAMDQALEESFVFAKEVGENSVSLLQNEGVEIIELDEDTMAKMKEAAEPAYALVREDLGDEVVDALLDAIQ